MWRWRCNVGTCGCEALYDPRPENARPIATARRVDPVAYARALVQAIRAPSALGNRLPGLQGAEWMYNFEHEVGGIRDRYLRYFVAYDYFHDGDIVDIRFVNDDRDVEFVVTCHREWYVDYGSHGPVFPEEVAARQFDDRYKYRLLFRRCRYLSCELVNDPPIYINGRFKDSARLAWTSKGSRRKYHHIRVQDAGGGYIDIIFAGFAIHKLEGDVVVPRRVAQLTPFAWPTYLCRNTPLEQVRETALQGDWLERYRAIQYLSWVGDPGIVYTALAALDSGDDEVRLAASYALGRHGDLSVLPNLASLWREVDYPIFRRHIHDAIEHILYRNGFAPHE